MKNIIDRYSQRYCDKHGLKILRIVDEIFFMNDLTQISHQQTSTKNILNEIASTPIPITYPHLNNFTSVCKESQWFNKQKKFEKVK